MRRSLLVEVTMSPALHLYVFWVDQMTLASKNKRVKMHQELLKMDSNPIAHTTSRGSLRCILARC